MNRDRRGWLLRSRRKALGLMRVGLAWSAVLTIAMLVPAQLGSLACAQEAPGAAPDAAARTAFEAGRDAYDHGQFSEALTQFERAYALSPHAKLLFNIARAAEADGRTGRAIEAYEGYLAALPEAENREFVEARLTKLRSAPPASPAPSPTAAPPAPAEAARAAENAPSATPVLVAGSPASAPAHDDGEPRPFWKRAWFWGVVGAVVVGAVTTGIVLSIDDDPKHAAADEHILTLRAR